jgi:hypothetical protein
MPGFIKRGTTPLENREVLIRIFEERLLQPLKINIPTKDIAKIVDEALETISLKYGLYKATAEEVVQVLGLKIIEYRNLHGLGKKCSKCGLNKK